MLSVLIIKPVCSSCCHWGWPPPPPSLLVLCLPSLSFTAVCESHRPIFSPSSRLLFIRCLYLRVHFYIWLNRKQFALIVPVIPDPCLPSFLCLRRALEELCEVSFEFENLMYFSDKTKQVGVQNGPTNLAHLCMCVWLARWFSSSAICPSSTIILLSPV